MIDFSDIGYLAKGNLRQQNVYEVLVKSEIMRRLSDFDPILVGTFPIGIDVASSDLDVACHFEDKAIFVQRLKSEFSQEQQFDLRQSEIGGMESVVCNFCFSGYKFEIFGQPIPVRSQMGYRHMMVEHKILREKGEEFRNAIVRLKSSGMKTEPAFAKLLGLKDGYLELLKFE